MRTIAEHAPCMALQFIAGKRDEMSETRLHAPGLGHLSQLHAVLACLRAARIAMNKGDYVDVSGNLS